MGDGAVVFLGDSIEWKPSADSLRGATPQAGRRVLIPDPSDAAVHPGRVRF